MRTLIISVCFAVIAYFCIAKILNFNSKKNKESFHVPDSLLFLVIPLVLLIANAFLTIVPAQQCGVVIAPSGVKQETYHTGWHIIMPWYKVELMEKTAQVYTCAKRTAPANGYKEYKADATQSETVWTPTIDGIKMGFDISASWRIDPEYAWWIYDNVSETDGAPFRSIRRPAAWIPLSRPVVRYETHPRHIPCHTKNQGYFPYCHTNQFPVLSR